MLNFNKITNTKTNKKEIEVSCEFNPDGDLIIKYDDINVFVITKTTGKVFFKRIIPAHCIHLKNKGVEVEVDMDESNFGMCGEIARC